MWWEILSNLASCKCVVSTTMTIPDLSSQSLCQVHTMKVLYTCTGKWSLGHTRRCALTARLLVCTEAEVKTCLHICSANKVLSTPPRTRHQKHGKMLCIYLLCPHSEHQNNPFQSKQSKHFHQRKQFTQCETGSNKVKLPKVGSNAIVPCQAQQQTMLVGEGNKQALGGQK